MRYFICLFVVWMCACSEADDVLVEPSPGSRHLFEVDGRYGYRDDQGQIAIEARYVLAQAFEGGIAYVVDQSGWLVIDRDGQEILRPFIYDNGPDPFNDGLARFVEQAKVGFYDKSGDIQLEAVYDFAEPFKSGRASVCIGCEKVMEGEHSRFEGGHWFVIDREGKRIE